NNFRLVIQPMLLFWLIHPGREIFPNSNLLLGFKHLINAMNQFPPFYSSA
ncbi:MAG TPA: IS701 family transposase, partial [Phormidium sp.]